jgi:hypothetical protein
MADQSITRLPQQVLLATEDKDLGIVGSDHALSAARDYADTFKKTVYVRDPVSDAVLRVVRPDAQG